MSISVLILTLNEEVNIDGCLESISWSDDVVVLDSLSEDRTVELAHSRGVRVVQRAFDNYANQRNYGLKEIQYKNPWLLLLDADERVPEELRIEMLEATRSAGDAVTLYRLRGKNHLYGRWIRGSSGYPTWFARLARVGHVWFERSINEELHTDGESRALQGHFHHYPFNKGFSAWIAKHDRYSSMEAELLAQKLALRWKWRDLVSGDAGARRRAAKALMYRLPARPVAVFFALYVFRGGMFDGRAGLTYSLLRAWYEYMIDCKCVELRRRARGLPV
jgi:glycosyltransferase involved in cell wall biosynthesis